MPKRLAVGLLLVAFGGCAQQPGDGSPSPDRNFRTVERHELVLSPFTTGIGDQTRQKSFRDRGIQGWVREDGRWSIEGPVRHSRLLCGTYQMGVQIGKGANACGLAEWSTPVTYGPDRLQCNGATLIHSGSGQSSAFAEQVANANCVRVLVRCTGSC